MVRATRSPPGSVRSIQEREAAGLPLADAAIAQALEEIADLLQAQDADPLRVQAWRNGAAAVRSLTEPAAAIVTASGEAGLRALPAIGPALARAILQLALTGRCTMLDRLRGASGPHDVLTTVSGIGPELAHRIHDTLHIDDLYELEIAAYDGRLAGVPGMGPGRLRTVRESLAGRLRHRPLGAATAVARLSPQDEPPVAELLDVDAEYRRKAAEDSLPRIAPKRSNPRGETWLPILHTHRGERHYTALFSNTVRAHHLGTTDDWVVIYRDDGAARGQWTAVTARPGDLAGRRIVRGREAECRAHYAEPAGA